MNEAGSDSVTQSNAAVPTVVTRSYSGDDKVWQEFDLAVAGFCFKQSLEVCESNSLVSTLVGEGKMQKIRLCSLVLNHPRSILQNWTGSEATASCLL